MRLSSCLFVSWLFGFGLPVQAGNYSCPSCNSVFDTLYCVNCDCPIEPENSRLFPDVPSMRSYALLLNGEIDISPSELCSQASRFGLQEYQYQISISYESEDPRHLTNMIDMLLPETCNFDKAHHVLFMNSLEGWLRIYLYFENDETAYVQVNDQWFYFSSWRALARWLAFLLATLQKGRVYSYCNLKPDHDHDYDLPPPMKMCRYSGEGFIDR